MTYFLHQFDIFEVLKEGEESHDKLLQLHKQNGQTVIYVTHDQQEAMALGDRIAVINDGKIQMIETPDSSPVEVGVVVDYGRYKQLTCRAFDNQRLKVVVNQWPVRPGKIVYATFEASAILLFDPKTNVNVIDSQPDYVLE